jgi:hypothetical protein
MTIAAYMDHLTNSKQARDEFHADPAGAMTRFGLSAADQAIVMTRDPAKIRAAAAKEDATRDRAMQITF